MTLDPVFETMLRQAPPPDITQMPPEAARQVMRDMVAVIGAKDVPIGKTENLSAPGPAGEIALRVYTPVAAGQTLSGIVFFHGGGWVIGDLDVYDGMCRALANELGARVVSVDYRLAPEHPFPAAVDDSFAALKWVEANASALGIDANAIAVAGDSAGGNLAAVCTLLVKKGGPKIGFQLLIYPVLSMTHDTESMRRYGEGYFLERGTMEWFGRHYIPEGADLTDPRLAPLSAPDLVGPAARLYRDGGLRSLARRGRALRQAPEGSRRCRDARRLPQHDPRLHEHDRDRARSG